MKVYTLKLSGVSRACSYDCAYRNGFVKESMRVNFASLVVVRQNDCQIKVLPCELCCWDKSVMETGLNQKGIIISTRVTKRTKKKNKEDQQNKSWGKRISEMGQAGDSFLDWTLEAYLLFRFQSVLKTLDSKILNVVAKVPWIMESSLKKLQGIRVQTIPTVLQWHNETRWLPRYKRYWTRGLQLAQRWIYKRQNSAHVRRPLVKFVLTRLKVVNSTQISMIEYPQILMHITHQFPNTSRRNIARH